MKIETRYKVPNTKTFGEIEVGECFKHEGMFFIKGMTYKTGREVGISLTTGVIFEFEDKTQVISINNIKVIVEE